MEPALVWLLLGLALVVVELLTGTFYLLILGLAAGMGALAAWLGGPVWVQALVVAIAGLAGSVYIRGRKLAAPRIAAARAEVVFAGSDAQAIALPDGCIDAALSTWSLCSVGDARRALGEVRRLLVPGGRYHFVEHGLSPDADVQRWQRRLEPLQRLLFGGCRLLLPVDVLLREAGFTLERLDTEYIAGPRFSSYVYRGVARANAERPSAPGGR